jgi:hypothetical protein
VGQCLLLLVLLLSQLLLLLLSQLLLLLLLSQLLLLLARLWLVQPGGLGEAPLRL